MGIGTAIPEAKLQVEGRTVINYTYADFNMSEQNYIKSMGGDYAALSFINFDHSNGVTIEHDAAGDLGVYDTSGFFYAPINASAFNINSDIRVKKDVNYISSSEYDSYLNQIRNIQSATFLYNYESQEKGAFRYRANPHVGFMAQSLPKELVTTKPKSKDGKVTDVMSYNLGDLAGLTVVGLKALDYKQQELESMVKSQNQIILQLQREIEQLKQK